MTSVGETLRAERLKRNLGLDQIAGELKISSKFLEAIETEHFDKLPGGVFTKSFVRQYARLLGLNDEELADQVQRVLEPPPSITQFAEKPKPIASDFHVPKMEAWESVGESRFQWSGSLSAAAVFVVVLLICSGVYTWMQRPRSVESAHVPPVVSSPVVSTPPLVSQPAELPAQTTPASTPSEAVPERTAAEGAAADGTAHGGTAPKSPAAKPEAEPQTEPRSVAAMAPSAASPSAAPELSKPVAKLKPGDPKSTVRIEVTADEPVWMLARTDGKFAFSGTLDTHQSRSVEATGNIVLRLGNAGGVTITLNGKPLGRVGPKGQVRTVQFTSGGFQIVAPKLSGAPDPL